MKSNNKDLIINTTANYIYFDGSAFNAPRWTSSNVFNRIGNGSRVTFMAAPGGEWIMLDATAGSITY